jgi:hypothetical protein
MQRTIRFLLLLACAGYIASLFSFPFACSDGEGWRGYHVLYIGFMGLVMHDPRWLANPAAFWLVAVSVLGRRAGSTSFISLAAVLLATSAATFPAAGCSGGGIGLTMSTGLQGGGYLWVGSVTLIAVCALFAPRRPPVAALAPQGAIAPAVQFATMPAGGRYAKRAVLATAGTAALGAPWLLGSAGHGPLTAAWSSVGTLAGLLLLLLGVFWPTSRTVQSGGMPELVQEALASYRAGRPVRNRCPRCRSVLVVTPDPPRDATGVARVRVSCACGACDGAYEVQAPPQE